MAAIHDALALLKAKIEGLGYTSFELRDEHDAVAIDELPGFGMKHGDVEILLLEGNAGGTATHRCPVFLDFRTANPDRLAARGAAYDMLAASVNALAIDYNLGGQVQEIQIVNYGGDAEMGNDACSVMLELRLDFCTSNDNFNTLIT